MLCVSSLIQGIVFTGCLVFRSRTACFVTTSSTNVFCNSPIISYSSIVLLCIAKEMQLLTLCTDIYYSSQLFYSLSSFYMQIQIYGCSKRDIPLSNPFLGGISDWPHTLSSKHNKNGKLSLNVVCKQLLFSVPPMLSVEHGTYIACMDRCGEIKEKRI